MDRRRALTAVIIASAGVAAAAVVGLTLTAASAGKSAPAAPPASALVVVYADGKVKAHRVTDAKQVAALAAHFPGYQTRPASNTAGGWKKGYDVYFDFADGVAVRVAVSSPRNTPAAWSAGRGDFAVEGDFHAFVAGLGE